MSRGRPRSASTRRAILAAALEVVSRNGYANATVDEIVRQARVGRQSLYRRWKSKADVVLDAVLEDAARYVSPKQTDDPARDLCAFLIATFRRLRTTGGVMRALMAEAQIDPAFRITFRMAFLAKRRAALRAFVARIVAPNAVDLVVDCIYGSMWYRLLDGHGGLDAKFAVDLLKVLGIETND